MSTKQKKKQLDVNSVRYSNQLGGAKARATRGLTPLTGTADLGTAALLSCFNVDTDNTQECLTLNAHGFTSVGGPVLKRGGGGSFPKKHGF